MNRSQSPRPMTTLVGSLAVAFFFVAVGRQSLGAEAGNTAVNLAAVAKPSSSNVSGDTSLAAMQDDNRPENSRVRGTGSYGNWPSKGTQWVQYDWSHAIATAKIDIYWWDDNRGVHLPAACRLLYWNGNDFVPVSKPSGLDVKGNQFNTTTFEEIRTSKLRLEIDGDGNFSTGILEWKVYDSGNSPDFPPSVTADIDRTVIRGGKTYLSGTLQTLGAKGPATRITWSKASGPGTVSFADAAALDTTATFSAEGDYVLKLTAAKGPLEASSTLAVTVVSPPPAKHFELIDTKKYTIDIPLWNGRAKALIVNWIPHCIKKISDPDVPQGGINNFIDAAAKLAGKPHGNHRGYVFSNAWVYNTIESICVALMVDPQGDQEIIEAQATMKGTLEDWIPKILAAQEPDGYLQTL